MLSVADCKAICCMFALLFFCFVFLYGRDRVYEKKNLEKAERVLLCTYCKLHTWKSGIHVTAYCFRLACCIFEEWSKFLSFLSYGMLSISFIKAKKSNHMLKYPPVYSASLVKKNESVYRRNFACIYYTLSPGSGISFFTVAPLSLWLKILFLFK